MSHSWRRADTYWRPKAAVGLRERAFRGSLIAQLEHTLNDGWTMTAHPSKWPASVRLSSYWLAAATACAVILNVALRFSEGLSVLCLLLGTVALTLWFGGLCIAGLVQGVRQRRRPSLALGWLLSPFAMVAVFCAALWLVWKGFGLLPWRAAETTDFQPISAVTTRDGKWRAVHVEDLSGGPMTGTSDDIYVVEPSSRRFQFKDRVFSAECVQNVTARWIDPRTLKVEFTSGDAPAISGLQPEPHLPWLHGRSDEMKKRDPVKVTQVRHLVRGNLC